MRNKKIFGLDKNIFSLGFVSFLTDLSSEMIYPLLPVFLTSVLGVKISFIGLIEGIAECTASLTKLFSGWISDKTKKRKLLVLIGYSISSISRPLVAIATSGWYVLAIRFFDRIGKGTRNSPRDALIAESCLMSERGKAFGFQRAMDHFGAVLGPIIAFLLLSLFTQNYRIVFLCAFIPAILSVIVIIFFVSEKKQSYELKKETLSLTLSSFDGKFKFFLVTVVIFTLGNSSDAFLILRAKDLGVSTALIPILWVFLHIVKTVSSIPGGIISDKFGRKNIIIAGWIIYAISYFGFGLATNQLQIWLLFIFYGFYFGLTEGVEKALVADLSRQEIRGTAYGTYYLATGIASLPSSLLMGILWQKFGSTFAFLTGSILAIISSILLSTISLSKNTKSCIKI